MERSSRRRAIIGAAIAVAALAAVAIVSSGERLGTAPPAAPPPASGPGPNPSAQQIIDALGPRPDSPKTPTRGIRPPDPLPEASLSLAAPGAAGVERPPPLADQQPQSSPGAPAVTSAGPPPVAPVSPPATASPAILSVDDALDKLRAAKVAFNTPERAIVGRPLLVEAKLSTHLSADALKVQIVEAGKVEVAELKVSDRMAATLTGGSAFDISPSAAQEQWISDKQETSWTWTVTPKSVGDQVLVISFDAIISINGKDDRRTINTLKRHINVDVGWPETAGEWLELVRHTGENLSWIWATLLIPIGGTVWAWLKKRRK